MLRGGIIGCGRMGITHFAILNTHPEVKLVAVCDESALTTKTLQRFTEVAAFSDYRRMLNEVDLDFVVVATPIAAHAEVGEAVSRHRVHMFMEKPLTLSTEEGQRLVQATDSANIVNQVGYFLRFNEIMGRVKTHVEGGHIGRPLHYINVMYGRTVLHPVRNGWRSKKRLGGGCLRDFASHSLDLADWVFGPPARVSGSVLGHVFSEDVEDTVYTTLHYRNGLTGILVANWSDESYRRPYNRIEIAGTQGKIIADRQECRLFLREDVSAELRRGWNVTYLPQVARPVRFDIRGSEFSSQLDHFIECIGDRNRRNECTFADACRTDRVMDDIEQDSQKKASHD
jgi:predicted dehydrogenase